MDVKLKDMEAINDKKVIQRYLQYTIDLNEEIYCFVKESELKFATRLLQNPSEDLLLQLEIPVEHLSGEALLKDLNATDDRQIMISFKAQDTMFLAKTDFVSTQPKVFTLKVLAPLFKLQRRQNQRFKPSKEFPITIHMPDGTHPLRVDTVTPLDISAGGFSLWGSEFEVKLFALGQHFTDWTLRTKHQSFPISVRVISHRETDRPGPQGEEWAIGFSFHDLDPKLEQELAKTAYLYTQRLFSRRI